MGNLFEGIAWIPVLVAAFSFFALGALWYSKLLFVKRWISDLKLDVNNPDAKKGMGLMFGGSFLMMLISCFAIAILAHRLGLSGWMSGLKLGVFVAACFGATAIATNYFYEKKPLSLFLINAGYQMTGCILAGIIICCWH